MVELGKFGIVLGVLAYVGFAAAITVVIIGVVSLGEWVKSSDVVVLEVYEDDPRWVIHVEDNGYIREHIPRSEEAVKKYLDEVGQ